MQCPTPISIPHPHGTRRSVRLSVPCGVCFACLTNRREEWIIRLTEETKSSKTAHFITLTYDDENIPINNNSVATIQKRDLQLFFKRLRKKIRNPIRYYAIGEYGTKSNRPHYHIISFNINPSDLKHIPTSWINVDNKQQLGHIKIGTVNVRSISYVAKYHINKTQYPKGAEKPFAIMSRGIGREYITQFKAHHLGKTYQAKYQMHQWKKPLPRYYKQKLYTEKERKEIAEATRSYWDDIEIKPGYIQRIKDYQSRIVNANKRYKQKSNYKNSI
jgi:hypothetical protein